MSLPARARATGVAAVLALVSALVLTACSGGETPKITAAADTITADLSGSGPGTVTSAVPLPLIDRRISGAARVVAKINYVSTSGVTGKPTSVSGAVFVPRIPAPEGGYRIVAFGHGSTGVDPECGPTRNPGLYGAAEPIAGLLNNGYVVALSDYQGLGDTSTYHPYLDSKTLGMNLIDSVRAARKIIPEATTRWAAVGGSEGGQAAWAANDLATTYGRGLNLQATVATSPVADITGIARGAVSGDLTNDQLQALQWFLVAQQRANPDLKLTDYVSDRVIADWKTLSSCSLDNALQRTALYRQLTPADFKPKTAAAARFLLRATEAIRLPTGSAASPMLVIFGGKDPFFKPRWTADAIERSCRTSRQPLQSVYDPDGGHANVDNAAAVPWLDDRFAGTEAPSFCGTDPLTGQAGADAGVAVPAFTGTPAAPTPAPVG